jgi:hypothetical protein
VYSYGVIADSVNGWAGPNNNHLLDHENGYPTGGDNGQPMLNWFCYTWSTTAGACPSTRGINTGADTRFATTKNMTQDVSLNVRWDVNERFGLNFDVQKIEATVDNFDNSASTHTASNLELDLRDGKPKFRFLAPTGFGMTEGGFADPANYFYEWTMEHTENSTGDEVAMRLDADIQLDTGWLDSMRVGVRRAERDQKVNWSTTTGVQVNPLWGVQGVMKLYANQELGGHHRGARFRSGPGRRRYVRRWHVHPPADAVHRGFLKTSTCSAPHSAADNLGAAAARSTERPGGLYARSNSRTSPKTSTPPTSC